jgi:ribosome-binding factor A
MSRPHGRQQRVEARLLRLLNELLQFEVKDPRLAHVRISHVELSGDLGVAKVYFSLLEPEADPGPAEEAFARARGFLRSKVGRALELRRVPELRFMHDTSALRGIEVTRLIEDSASSDDS